MPHKKPPGYEPPLKVLEHTRKINRKEAAFTKKRGPWAQLEDISTKRKRHSVYFSAKKIKDKLYHTHIKTIITNDVYTLPSIGDLVTHLEYTYIKKNCGAEGIFIINPKTGKNIGRTFFMFTSKTMEIINKQYEEYKNTISDDYIKQKWCKNDPELCSILKKEHNSYNTIKKIILFRRLLKKRLRFLSSNEYINKLEEKFGIKIRFVAMPGYKFNKKK